MSTRKPHPKSHRGCITCKRRHVKCDEAGPPCGRCKIRGDACEYQCAALQSSPNDGDAFTSASEGPTLYRSAQRREVILDFPGSKHLLELQLMHRWTASTYKCCCTPGSEDDEVWESWVPELAIKHGYLLYGIFSLTAFEIAKLAQTPDRQRYVESAIEYHGLALSSFCAQISAINSDNIDATVCMSLMLLILAFASVQARAIAPSDDESDRMVKAVLAHVELLRGITPIIESKQDYLSQNRYIQRLKPFEALPRTSLDPRIEEVLVKLAELNDERIISSVNDTDQRRVEQIEYWEACKNALSLLRTLYEKCVDDSTRGYSLGWLNMAGDKYVTAVNDGDAVALLLLMYWGVLVERGGHQVWWVEKFGSCLVVEIARRPLFENADAAVKNLILRAQQDM